MPVRLARSTPMKLAIAAAWITVAFSAIASDEAKAEPVLMLDEARDIGTAKYSCEWAANSLKGYDYLIKAFQCSENELCDRVIHINSAGKGSGRVAEVRAFHSKLLAQF